jgi:hypothetical protein
MKKFHLRTTLLHLYVCYSTQKKWYLGTKEEARVFDHQEEELLDCVKWGFKDQDLIKVSIEPINLTA